MMSLANPGVADIEPAFPDPRQAGRDGLVAIGGDLSPQRLLNAYGHGIFPWFDDDRGPVLWWSPDPRAVLTPAGMKISRSLAKRLRRGDYAVTMDTDFPAVVERCAAPRKGGGTWITPAMRSAYAHLAELGFAHSVETWCEGDLVGGLYGVSLGRMFFGESMFSKRPDASKVALAHLSRQLAAWDFELIDCQIVNDHLASLGARPMPRADFLDRLARNRHVCTRRHRWRFDPRPARRNQPEFPGEQ